MATIQDWLKEVDEHLTKKASYAELESVLNNLSVPELEALVFSDVGNTNKNMKKIAESDVDKKRYTGAVVGGALGSFLGGLAIGASKGESAKGALAYGVIKGLGGALGGHVYESEWGKKSPVGRYVAPMFLGGLEGVGGSVIGARLHGGPRPQLKKESEHQEKLASLLYYGGLAGKALAGRR